MNVNDNALPTGDTVAAAGGTTDNAAAPNTDQGNLDDGTGAGGAPGGGEGNGAAAGEKKEKTAEQREIDRLRRRVDNLTRQKYELRAAVPAATTQHQHDPADDDEPVTLTRAELNQRIAEQAKQLAPTMREQQAEAERRNGVVTSLAKEWGPEKFDNLSAELDEAFNGLIDRRGAPKPATDAIFEADNPKDVIEYLTDPDNADEAGSISRMNALQAGRAIAKIEQKIEAAKSKDKPQPSKAPAPIEPARGGGVHNGMPDPSDTKAYIAWANAQERAQR